MLQYGWTKAWALIATHHSITALLWNLGCWLPGLLVEQLFEINNMGLQIALSVPCIAVVSKDHTVLLFHCTPAHRLFLHIVLQ